MSGGIGGVGGSRSVDTHTETPAAPASETHSTSTTSNVSRTPTSTRVTTPATAPTSAATTHATTLSTVSAGTLADGSSVSFDPATGKFAGKTAGGAALSQSEALYKAAQLVAEGKAAFLTDPKIGAAGRLKMAQTLEAAIGAGNTATGTPKLADQQSRSGAATVALALAKTLPEGDAVKGRLVAAYTTEMGKEPLKGLRASMALNLEEAKAQGKVKLTAPQATALAAAKESTLPSKPPYDGWFKNGKTDLNVKQYIHPEFYDAMMSGYREQGFKVNQDLGDGHVKMSCEYTDPASGKKMKVNVEVIKTYAEDKKPEKRLFNDMSDPDTDIEFYTGHSNLGGNVLGALQAGPNAQKGDKWIIDWMCRGTQVIADVQNRFPDAHYTTTTDPAYVVNSGKFLGGMFQGIAERKGYDAIWDKMGDTRLGFTSNPNQQLKDWFLKPNDARILNVRDMDKDGKVDVSKLSGTDPLYNVGLKAVGTTSQTLKPKATTANPADLPGDKVMRGVNFLNTILHYHLDEEEHPGGNDGRLPKGVDDKIFASGWYKSSGDEMVKVEKKVVDGKPVYDVKVNSKYADQDVNALGAAIQYEVNKQLSIEKNGAYTEQDKLRGILLAGEYMSYMCDTYEDVTAVSNALKQKYGFNDKLTWENISAAIEADGHGYVSPDATKELKKLIGSADPSKG